MTFFPPKFSLHKKSPVFWFWLLFTLLVFSSLIKLGLWQSQRAEEKDQRLARISEYKLQQARPLTRVLALEQQGLDINDMPVSLQGKFAENVLFFLDNQLDRGRPGYRVYQVLQLERDAVLVNLGWVPGSVNRSLLPQIAPVTGAHNLRGNIRKLEPGVMLKQQDLPPGPLAANAWPLRVQQIEPEKFSPLIARRLLPFVVYLDKNEALGYKKNWQAVVMPPEKHRAYAFQWFSLATAFLVLMIWASRHHNKQSQVNNKVQGH
ncbi:SURF1 family protein [Thalassomonas viridans]|uniref:SURF1-like protein n=1 Tax=Thalassomonas viridans TaxID=137584 RepID=A0AAF0C7R7_9GAMM|nr:SURF1 family protein [Thalassomonas viridans]WDE05592.1 SURF1 family protein [Thalassomonas viridans]